MSDRAELHQKNLEKIFNPQSVAIIGANQNKGTVPFDILSGILSGDFNGVIYPVSPGRTRISVLKAYKYVVDIEDPVDLGVIVFPSTVTHMALEQCGQKGIKSVIIISAGFREVEVKALIGKNRSLRSPANMTFPLSGPIVWV